MNASPPTSARAPVQFAAPPTTTSNVGVGGSFDSPAASSSQTTLNTLEALHRASRSYNTRLTRRRHSSATRSAIPTVPDVVPSNRSRKRHAPEAALSTPPVRSTPRKRARAKVSSLKKPPPPCKLEESPSTDSQETLEQVSCCICMCDAEPNNLAGINGCEHQFCFGCIEKWAERENTCPLCKVRFTKIDRKNKKRRKGQKNTKKVKQRDQRSDLVSGTALEGLLANFASTHAPSNLTRLFLPVYGALGDFNAPLGHSRSFRSIAIARGGDSSDEDDSTLSSLFRVYSSSMPPMMPMMQQMSFASRFTTTRSYASNMHDRTAGRGAENPLTIDDSDSDDDDIVVLSHRAPL